MGKSVRLCPELLKGRSVGRTRQQHRHTKNYMFSSEYALDLTDLSQGKNGISGILLTAATSERTVISFIVPVFADIRRAVPLDGQHFGHSQPGTAQSLIDKVLGGSLTIGIGLRQKFDHIGACPRRYFDLLDYPLTDHDSRLLFSAYLGSVPDSGAWDSSQSAMFSARIYEYHRVGISAFRAADTAARSAFSNAVHSLCDACTSAAGEYVQQKKLLMSMPIYYTTIADDLYRELSQVSVIHELLRNCLLGPCAFFSQAKVTGEYLLTSAVRIGLLNVARNHLKESIASFCSSLVPKSPRDSKRDIRRFSELAQRHPGCFKCVTGLEFELDRRLRCLRANKVSKRK